MLHQDEIPDELMEYIKVKVNGYFVKKGSFEGNVTFGKFNSLKESCAAACILNRNNWRLRDVARDPLVKYDNEFWVFKVEESQLVFDNKFDDYESAVEYMEINSKCNDYHNDIFRNSLKKNDYKMRGESINNIKQVAQEKYIFKLEDKFLLKKSKNADIIYGEFNSYEGASAAKKVLIDSKWRISNEHEVVYYENVYWVFDVHDGILNFKGKSESYEDAFDILEDRKPKIYSDNPYIISIEDNLKKPILQNKKNKEKLSVKNVKLNVKKRKVDVTRIWNHILENKFEGKSNFTVFANKCYTTTDKLFILDFDIVNNCIRCKINGNEIDWKKRYTLNVSGLPEFQLIIDILEKNDWDFLKIKESSPIYYYYNSYFYKIHLVDNVFIFDRFESYSDAKNIPLNYKKLDRVDLDLICPSDIDKLGYCYELVKFHNGEVYKIEGLTSLPEIKAIRDILLLSNWDFNIFDKYDLFYLNGIYWELRCKNHIINLIGKFQIIDVNMV